MRRDATERRPVSARATSASLVPSLAPAVWRRAISPKRSCARMSLNCSRHPPGGWAVPRSEQGASCPLPKHSRLAERDKHMSEAKSFMQELDDRTAVTVISPLLAVASAPLEEVEA